MTPIQALSTRPLTRTLGAFAVGMVAACSGILLAVVL